MITQPAASHSAHRPRRPQNVPRKRAKFMNFVRNLGVRGASTSAVERTWEMFEQALKKSSKPTAQADVLVVSRFSVLTAALARNSLCELQS